ncbi:MAG: hypothetical protein ABH840_01265 [Nanoarchaeota archaeon]
MSIGNYEIDTEKASNIPEFYFPGSEVYANGLKFIGRDDERPNPTVEFEVEGIPGSRCKLTLRPDRPIVQFGDIVGNDLDRIKLGVEKALCIQLS